MRNLDGKIAVVTGASRGVGQGIALASDPGVMEKSGRVLTAGECAAEYGFIDIDGRRLPPFRLEA